MAQLMTIGEILVEFMAQDAGQTFTSAGHFKGPFASGAPAIMISQAARLGADCGIIACVGPDDFGTLCRDRLTRDGADTRGIVSRPGETTGVAFVRYTKAGSRHFIFHFSKAAAGTLTAQDVDPALLEDTQIFHIMGCSLAASATLSEAVIQGARLAKQQGAALSFDPNFRPELLSTQAMRDNLSWALRHCDILLSGREELAQVSGQPYQKALVEQVKQNKLVVIKEGKEGARLFADGTETMLPAYPVTEVDPTGAGDCFDGAFLAMLLSGKSPLESAKIANAASALSVTKLGPMEGVPYLADIQALMDHAGQ